GTTPYNIQSNMNIQRELFRNTVLTVGYVGSRGVNQLSFRDFNPPKVETDAQGVQHFGKLVQNANGSYSIVSNARLNPNFGTLSLTQPSSTSRYSGLQTSL